MQGSADSFESNFSSLSKRRQRLSCLAHLGKWMRCGEWQVLKSAGYVTADRDQADFFLVPAWLYSLRCCLSGGHCLQHRLAAATLHWMQCPAFATQASHVFVQADHGSACRLLLEKVHKVFFAGASRDKHPDYSHGVRQTIFRLFSGTAGKLSRLLGAYNASVATAASLHHSRHSQSIGQRRP